MKAHQNRNMTYDEMNEYVMSMERRNLREVAYCHYFNHKVMFMCSYERNVLSVHNAMHHLGDASPLPIVGGKPTGPTCQS